jgi:hypothetical protein
MRTAAALAAALAVVMPPLATPAAAQARSHQAGDGPRCLFPDRSLLPDVLAGPRDPVITGQLVYADPNPTAYGPGPSGEVAIAGTLPLLLLAGTGPEDALVLGMEGAAFAHFSFATVTRELVNTDWVFAVPLVWRRGSHWARLRYYHTSSHLGDEYQRRFGPSSINFSRDGADLTLYVRPAAARPIGLGLYAGALWSMNSHPEQRSLWRGRGGFEMDPSAGDLWAPYIAVDVELEEGSPHGPRYNAQAGVWLPRAHDRPLRLALEWTSGPSPMGQFTFRDTRRVSLGLFWNP